MKLTKLFGLHAVQAAIDYSPDNIKRAWVDQQRTDKRCQRLTELLNAQGVVAEKVERKKLDRLADGSNHQGIVIEAVLPGELSEDELQNAVSILTGSAFFLILDQVQDPHNLGACLRTADAAGVHGVIITKDNSAGITPTVCKVACGAAETVPVYCVTNLSRTLRWLKEQGIWVIGAAGDATQLVFDWNFNIPVAIVVGAEGKGLRRLTRDHCDVLVKLPMQGTVESLNLSVATGVLLYEAVRQRLVDSKLQ